MHSFDVRRTFVCLDLAAELNCFLACVYLIPLSICSTAELMLALYMLVRSSTAPKGSAKISFACVLLITGGVSDVTPKCRCVVWRQTWWRWRHAVRSRRRFHHVFFTAPRKCNAQSHCTLVMMKYLTSSSFRTCGRMRRTSSTCSVCC